jgi:hypothetical protein
MTHARASGQSGGQSGVMSATVMQRHRVIRLHPTAGCAGYTLPWHGQTGILSETLVSEAG